MPNSAGSLFFRLPSRANPRQARKCDWLDKFSLNSYFYMKIGSLSERTKYDTLNENELAAVYARNGDPAAVGVLYERLGHLVLGLCIKYFRNRDEAEEAVLVIFGKLLDDLRKHKVEHFRSWLYIYSKNHCLMELRKRSAALKRELELKENAVLFMDSEDPGHLNEKERQLTLMESAIARLGEEQGRCIRMFYLENRSYAEIARLTGYSDKEVKSHIQNGKRNLKIRLETLINERGE
jgi:RNA polymerase sigma-70 factor, ECF subfamily